MSSPRILVVGAGLTGCTLAHHFARAGLETVLLERAEVPGGLIRSEHMNGVLYEPHGSHIFHTEDQEVWELSAQWAPRRVSVRWDNDPYLFPDPYQGWPAGPNGYTDLIDGLLDDPRITVHVGTHVTLETLDARRSRARARRRRHRPHVPARRLLRRALRPPRLARHRRPQRLRAPQGLRTGAMVVNYPGAEFPFIRIHETKHASRQECEGTVLGFEFTGAPTRYYPIETERNRSLNDHYQDELRRTVGGERLFSAGRLANYLYIDMDDCMRQAIDASAEVLDAVGADV